MPTSRVPASAFSTASSATVVSPSEVAGSDGTVVSGGAVKFSAPVMSPVKLRRQELRFGTSTPNLPPARPAARGGGERQRGQVPPCGSGGRGPRWQVFKEPAVLVVDDEEH